MQKELQIDRSNISNSVVPNSSIIITNGKMILLILSIMTLAVSFFVIGSIYGKYLTKIKNNPTIKIEKDISKQIVKTQNDTKLYEVHLGIFNTQSDAENFSNTLNSLNTNIFKHHSGLYAIKIKGTSDLKSALSTAHALKKEYGIIANISERGIK